MGKLTDEQLNTLVDVALYKAEYHYDRSAGGKYIVSGADKDIIRALVKKGLVTKPNVCQEEPYCECVLTDFGRVALDRELK